MIQPKNEEEDVLLRIRCSYSATTIEDGEEEREMLDRLLQASHHAESLMLELPTQYSYCGPSNSGPLCRFLRNHRLRELTLRGFSVDRSILETLTYNSHLRQLKLSSCRLDEEDLHVNLAHPSVTITSLCLDDIQMVGRHPISLQSTSRNTSLRCISFRGVTGQHVEVSCVQRMFLFACSYHRLAELHLEDPGYVRLIDSDWLKWVTRNLTNLRCLAFYSPSYPILSHNLGTILRLPSLRVLQVADPNLNSLRFIRVECTHLNTLVLRIADRLTTPLDHLNGELSYWRRRGALLFSDELVDSSWQARRSHNRDVMVRMVFTLAWAVVSYSSPFPAEIMIQIAQLASLDSTRELLGKTEEEVLCCIDVIFHEVYALRQYIRSKGFQIVQAGYWVLDRGLFLPNEPLSLTVTSML